MHRRTLIDNLSPDVGTREVMILETNKVSIAGFRMNFEGAYQAKEGRKIKKGEEEKAVRRLF